jgi:hypothetical protein
MQLNNIWQNMVFVFISKRLSLLQIYSRCFVHTFVVADAQLMADLDMEEIYHINLEWQTLSNGIQCVRMWVKIGNTDW